jgi:hypothetical protein
MSSKIKSGEFFVAPNVPFAKKHGYKYVGDGWFIPIHTYKIAMAGVMESPVKYNGSFLDTIPQ